MSGSGGGTSQKQHRLAGNSHALHAERSASVLRLVDDLDDVIQQHRDAINGCIEKCFLGIFSAGDDESSSGDRSPKASTVRGQPVRHHRLVRPREHEITAAQGAAGRCEKNGSSTLTAHESENSPPTATTAGLHTVVAGATKAPSWPDSPRPRVSLSAAWASELEDDSVDESVPLSPKLGATPLMALSMSERRSVDMVNVVPSGGNQEEGNSPGRTLKSVVKSLTSLKDAKKSPSARRTAVLSESKKLEILAQQTCLQKLVSSRQWEIFSVTLILLNALFIGVVTQYLSLQAQEEALASRPVHIHEPAFFFGCQVCFCILFTFELTLRWVAEGLLGFWQTPDLGWNILDLGVVIIGLADLIAGLLVSASVEQGPVTVLRVVRVVRVLRVARIIRVLKFFRELRMMIMSIMNSFKSLLWAVLVLLLLFYVFGTSFASATTNHLETVSAGNEAISADLMECFGTLSSSILSLYMAMSGGNDWGQYFVALEDLGSVYQLLFLGFITFAVFAVFNIVTGVFVESAMQSSQADRESVVQDEMAAQQAYLRSMQMLFEEIDEDESGCITQEEFESRLDDPRVAAYFNSLKLDVSDAGMLFELLDEDGSKQITCQEFVAGCKRMQGESRSLDTKIMQHEVKTLKRSVEKIYQLLRQQSSLT